MCIRDSPVGALLLVFDLGQCIGNAAAHVTDGCRFTLPPTVVRLMAPTTPIATSKHHVNEPQSQPRDKVADGARTAVGGVVPHYFGPYGNYANSPQHLPTAIVTFGPPDPAGLGSRTAMGTAVVNDAGVVTGVTVTDPGAGYSSAPAVTFSGISGSGGGGPGSTARAMLAAPIATTACDVSHFAASRSMPVSPCT